MLIEKTRETLRKNELKISKLADIYYQKVAEGGSKKLSMNILDAISKLDYDVIEKEFEVIEDEPKVSVFIEIDNRAEEIWRQYKDISNKDSPEEQKRNLRNFLRDKRTTFYNYIINTRPSFVEEHTIPFERPFYYLERQSLSNYYGYSGLKKYGYEFQ
jgi:hypothetical protein